MSGMQPETKESRGGSSRLLLFLAILVGVMAILFHRSFLPNQILFANDGPLGLMKAENAGFPGVLTGHWADLNWLGFDTPAAAPNLTAFLASILSPDIFLKVFAPITLLFAGFGAWLFFRQLKFSPAVCALGGIAVALNMHFFSQACWGLGTWNMCAGAMFLAMAALVSGAIPAWARAIFAGLAVGLGVMEGFDLGAILSIYVGIFVVFVIWNSEGGTTGKAVKTVWMPALVVACSALIAIHTVSSLVGTQIKGIAGTSQDGQTKSARWNEATMWSFPKLETFRLFIPGVFGYRLENYINEADHSSAYWGRVGEDLSVTLIDSNDPKDRLQLAQMYGMPKEYQDILANPDPQARKEFVAAFKAQTHAQIRHSGTGAYAGILVGLLALFGIASSLRGAQTPYATPERRAVWFWTLAAFISLFMAFGKYSSVYRLFYELPYASTIRSPYKFLFPFHMAWIILAAYGLEALRRRYMPVSPTPSEGVIGHMLRWWRKATGFEKKWGAAWFVIIGLSIFAALLCLSSRDSLQRFITEHGFAPEAARGMTLFFYGELAWFIVYLLVSAVLILSILSGAWSGKRAKWAWIAVGLVLVCDLARSDWRWINYYDFNQRYASNAVIDYLRDKTQEGRVTGNLEQPNTALPRFQGIANDQILFATHFFILQNQIPYLNIQSLDFIQMPRMPELDRSYQDAFRHTQAGDFKPCVRMWQLTNTRYVLAATEGNNFGNLNFDKVPGFQRRLTFDVAAYPWVTQVFGAEDLTYTEKPDGHYALYEYTNTLPRAKLYSNWQIGSTNAQEDLTKLASPAFDPTKTVIVSPETPVPPGPSEPNADPGTVTITSYKSKNVKLQASAKTASVLLLNDRTASAWNVLVDGQPANMLRCNYIMRGVYLPKGEHSVEFRYQPPINTLYVSFGAWGLGILVAGFLVCFNRAQKPSQPGKPSEKDKTSKTA